MSFREDEGGKIMNRRALLALAWVHSASLACHPNQTSQGSHQGPDGADLATSQPSGMDRGLSWPIDCVPGMSCSVAYPDVDGDGLCFDCSQAVYPNHQGTDIAIGWDQMDAGTKVLAAESGEVLWVFDGHYDRCPSSAQPECQAPTLPMGPKVESGFMVCSDAQDEYCAGNTRTRDCYYCFYGGNVIVIRHPASSQVFATRYDHLRRGSILVKPGQKVAKGEPIAEVGSAGNSTGPHLHFEVWVGGFSRSAEPWAGPCGPNHGPELWERATMPGDPR
jgi:murein DD-endopeptidase MepM/ murein hydrolase activator NlpD